MDRDLKAWNYYHYGQTRSIDVCLLYEYYDLGMADVWNNCNVMNQNLQICTRVVFGKSAYTRKLGSSEQCIQYEV